MDVPAAIRLAELFGTLLDRRAGSFRVGPYGLMVPLSIRYVPGTMILETTWMCPSGWVIVRDGLTIGPWHDQHADESHHTRPPTDQRLLRHASPLGMYAEELDASSGRHLGNYPQAFTHLGLINAVLNVIAGEESRA